MTNRTLRQKETMMDGNAKGIEGGGHVPVLLSGPCCYFTHTAEGFGQ